MIIGDRDTIAMTDIYSTCIGKRGMTTVNGRNGNGNKNKNGKMEKSHQYYELHSSAIGNIWLIWAMGHIVRTLELSNLSTMFKCT